MAKIKFEIFCLIEQFFIAMNFHAAISLNRNQFSFLILLLDAAADYDRQNYKIAVDHYETH